MASWAKKEEGRLASYGQPPYRAGQAMAKAPCKGATDCSQGQPAREAGAACKARKDGAARGNTRLQRDARKGGRLQGAHKGLPPAASPTASRGSDVDRRGGRSLAGWLPTGKGNCRLHIRGVRADGARGLGHPFKKRMIRPFKF
ncbi:hypothetical protein BHM03_00043847 [Ensete ventricosum]|nr:hypothetical protein BHM03_00043847 [Ensete ventricosum]